MTSTCNTGAQDPSWCPQSTADALPAVLGLLPAGPAWDGAAQEGTVANSYWSAIANVTAWVYSQLCLYLLEFFCNTATQSLDQWQYDYGLPNPCDPYGDNLCAKVTAIGGQSCETFVNLAASTGWVISCVNMVDVIHEPYAGIMMAGCAQMSTTPIFNSTVQPTTYAPGTATPAGANTISFGNQTSPTPAAIPSMDRNGNYSSWGQSFTWLVTLHLAESFALQGQTYVSGVPLSNAGNIIAGCTPLCDGQDPPPTALCWLAEVAPAHTNLVVLTTP